MTTTETNPNPTPGDRQRAGQAIRAWVQGDLEWLGLLMAQVTEDGRGFHLIAALCTEITEILHLRDSPQAMVKLDLAILRYADEERARLEAEE